METNNQEKNETVSKSIEEALSGMAMDQARELESDMLALLPKLELENKKFPAKLFEKDFLRLFTGQITEDEAKANNAIAVWIAIAGSPHMPVDLVDEENNVVAKVPALFNSEKFIKNNSDADRGVFVNAINDLEQMRKIHPRRAYLAYMARLLPYTEKLTADNGINNLEDWFKLFKYFNINPDKATPEKQAANIADELFDYD